MKSEIEYEDLMHDLLAMMVPELKLSNIRPAYQSKGGFAAENAVNASFSDGVSGFTTESDFIYFAVIYDDGTFESHTSQDGNVGVTRSLRYDISVYGINSYQYALKIYALFNHPSAMKYLNERGLYRYDDKRTQINQFNEVINGEWWKRRDLSVWFTEDADISEKHTRLDDLILGEVLDVNIVEDGKTK